MKMNSFPWIRRILVCTAIVCLTVTGLGAQPAQASPPATVWSALEVKLFPPPRRHICVGEKMKMRGLFIYNFKIFTQDDVQKPEGNPQTALIKFSAQFGRVDPPSKTVRTVANKIEIFEFMYTATKPGIEKPTAVVTFAGKKEKDNEVFQVDSKDKCKRDIHGTADIGSVIQAMSGPNYWDFVGTYDIAGTIQMNEDGTLSGQGTANLFTDGFFTGGLEDITCEHLSPWQGNTTVEIEADPNAWTNENILKLTLTMQPMQINTTRVVCQGDEGYGWADSPALSVASFDLNPQALPAEGGSTSLDFQFPNGRATLHMDLIVTSQEAGS